MLHCGDTWGRRLLCWLGGHYWIKCGKDTTADLREYNVVVLLLWEDQVTTENGRNDVKCHRVYCLPNPHVWSGRVMGLSSGSK